MDSDEKRIAQNTFNDAYEQYYESIYRFCLSRLNTGSEYAQDCTQEVFLVFYSRLKKGETFEYPRAFLYRTAVNIVKQFNDKHLKIKANETEFDERTEASDINNVIEKISYEVLTERIGNTLKDNDLKLFNMYFIEEIKVKDIARALNISPATCATRLHRLRQRLKEIINDYI